MATFARLTGASTPAGKASELFGGCQKRCSRHAGKKNSSYQEKFKERFVGADRAHRERDRFQSLRLLRPFIPETFACFNRAGSAPWVFEVCLTQAGSLASGLHKLRYECTDVACWLRPLKLAIYQSPQVKRVFVL